MMEEAAAPRAARPCVNPPLAGVLLGMSTVGEGMLATWSHTRAAQDDQASKAVPAIEGC